jgi:hypothetical protein
MKANVRHSKERRVIIRLFNRAWEKERALIEEQLTKKLADEIRSIDASMRSSSMTQEDRLELNKLRNQLVVRKSIAVYESEEIARNRMQLRTSYLAVFMSSVALIISVATVLLKINA